MSLHPWNTALFDDLSARAESLPHALLIHGVQGVGKLALAERMAQRMLCEGAVPRPCGGCDACRWYLAGNHPDLRRVEPEALAPQAEPGEEGEAPAPSRKTKPSSEIKVEQVREWADFLNLRSPRGGRRVALVHPAEAMNANAANALLKGLEEPPAAAMFILVSHRPARLLPTIRSRCVAVPVPVPAREAAQAWLQGQGVANAARWLAYAGGAPLRALDYSAEAEKLERLISAIQSSRSGVLVDDREALEALAEALQKLALDRGLAAHGLAPKYQSGASARAGADPKAWLEFARAMGRNRMLARHPLNPRLFAAEMMAGLPDHEKP
jgi:DNA polymerase-3 subunit delta'